MDEIGTKKEAQAIKTIGHRGTAVIGTAHGNTLADVAENPELVGLLGGKNIVTLGDMSAFAR